jgi:hypothetical protein
MARNPSRVKDYERTESIEPRSDFPDAPVDPTEARKGTNSGVSTRTITATPAHATGMMAVVFVSLSSDNCH